MQNIFQSLHVEKTPCAYQLASDYVPKKYFLVYYDNAQYQGYLLNKLIASVRAHSDFEVIVYQKSQIDRNFSETHKHILTQPRGGGYWLWKPYIINDTLKKINYGDYLFYLDCKYYIYKDFSYLYKDIEQENIIVWKNKPNEHSWFMKNWCKMDVIAQANMYETIFNNNKEDCWAGAVFCKKTDYTMDIISQWLNLCVIPHNITDSPSLMQNHHEFKEHRHDQSLLSVVLYKNNIQPKHMDNASIFNLRTPLH